MTQVLWAAVLLICSVTLARSVSPFVAQFSICPTGIILPLYIQGTLGELKCFKTLRGKLCCYVSVKDYY